MTKDPLTKATKPSHLSSATILFLLLAPFVVVLYSSFLFNVRYIDNTIVWFLQAVADVISMTVLISLWLNILLDVLIPKHHRVNIIPAPEFLDTLPTVDILIPVYGEPISIIEKTLEAAVNIKYRHKTFILDDGKSKNVEALASKYGAKYVTRKITTFAKSGNLNNGLKESTSKFFAVFDADQCAAPDFLHETLPYMSDPSVAMVQTPQHFSNTEKFIPSGTAESQEIFYKYVCPAKNLSNSAFCVGTNVLFRREAIDSIGGIALVNHSEDIWTSFLLHENSWYTIFLNKVLALGQAPDNIPSFFKQQLRWARGGLSMLFFHNPMNSTKLHLDQKLQYASANLFYLVGFTMMVYMATPLLYLLFGIKAFQAESTLSWLVHYLPYFGVYYALTWLLLGRLRLSTIATSLSSFYPYVLAFISIIFGVSIKWTSTTTHNKGTAGLLWIWPHVLILSLTAIALIIGWLDPADVNTTIYNSFWALWNAYMIYMFITGEKRLAI